MGLSGQIDHYGVFEAVAEVGRATASKDKFAGIGGIGDEALLRRYIAMDMRFILGGNDFAFMMTAAKQRAKKLRAID